MKKVTTFLAVILTINLSFGQIQKATTESGKTVTLNTNGTWEYTEGFNYNTHNDFKVFWTDFKKAIADNDKKALEAMTKFPFTDFNEKAYERNGLTCNTIIEYQKKITQIFPNCAKSLFANGQPEKVDTEMLTDYEKNAAASFCLFTGGSCGAEVLGYVFGKDKGLYKLVGLKYME